MTPAAKTALAIALETAQALSPRVNNRMIRARHAGTTDQERLDNVRDAKHAATEILQKILIAEAALQANRRAAEP